MTERASKARSAILIYSRECERLFRMVSGVRKEGIRVSLGMHLRGDRAAHRFRILCRVEQTLRKFLGQFEEQFLRQGILFFPAGRQCQQDLGIRLQVPSLVNGASKLLGWLPENSSCAPDRACLRCRAEISFHSRRNRWRARPDGKAPRISSWPR